MHQPIKTSGAKQRFENGAVRDTDNDKPDFFMLSPWVWRLLPYGDFVHDYLISRNPVHMEYLLQDLLHSIGYDRLCNWLTVGAQHYGDFNWALGMPVSRCLGSLGRHLNAVRLKQSDEDHEAAAACNAMFILHYHREIQAGRLDPKWLDLFDYNRINTNG
jgi:hypothetical protein